MVWVKCMLKIVATCTIASPIFSARSAGREGGGGGVGVGGGTWAAGGVWLWVTCGVARWLVVGRGQAPGLRDIRGGGV